MYKNLLIGIIALFFSIHSQAEWANNKKLLLLKASTGGIVFRLNDFENTSDKFSCGDNKLFFMHKPRDESGDDNYQARASFLLSAYMGGKEIDVSYYECNPVNGNTLNVGSVQFN